MAAETLEEGDEIYIIDKHEGYIFGVVEELGRKKIKVSWTSSNHEAKVDRRKVHLQNRFIEPHLIVKRVATGSNGMFGLVKDVNCLCHLNFEFNDSYIYNINSNELTWRKFQLLQVVMLDSRIGRIWRYNVDVVLLFLDGARCQVSEKSILEFEVFFNYSQKNLRRSLLACEILAGQRLRVPNKCLKDAEWLQPTPEHCQKTIRKNWKCYSNVTVEKIVYKNVIVKWFYYNREKDGCKGTSCSIPACAISDSDVDRLQVVDAKNYTIPGAGIHVCYALRNNDHVSAEEPSQFFNPKTAFTQYNPGKDIDHEVIADQNVRNLILTDNQATAGQLEGGQEVINNLNYRDKRNKMSKEDQLKKRQLSRAGDMIQARVELTQHWATVVWQDGSIEKDIPSVELLRVDDFEFPCGLTEFLQPDADHKDTADYGVIVRVDQSEKTCVVNWMKEYEPGKATTPVIVASNVEVSLFAIQGHAKYRFFPGDMLSYIGDSSSNSQDIYATASSQTNDQKFGQFIACDRNGRVLVKWIGGGIGRCYPQEVYSEFRFKCDEGNNEFYEFVEASSNIFSHLPTTVLNSDEEWETDSEHEIIEVDDSEQNVSGLDEATFADNKTKIDLVLNQSETLLAQVEKFMNASEMLNMPVVKCLEDIQNIASKYICLTAAFQISKDENYSLIVLTFMDEILKVLKRFQGHKSYKKLSDTAEACRSSQLAQDGSVVGGEHVLPYNQDTVTGAAGDVSEMRNNSSYIHNLVSCRCLSTEHAYGEPVETKRTRTESGQLEFDACSGGLASVFSAEDDGMKDSDKKDGDSVMKNNENTDVEVTMASCKEAHELCYKMALQITKEVCVIQTKLKEKAARLLKAAQKDGISSEVDATIQNSDGAEPLATGNIDMELKLDSHEDEDTPSKRHETSDTLNEDSSSPIVEVNKGQIKGFEICRDVLLSHEYASAQCHPANPQVFRATVRKELKLFQTSLPDGIFVKGFEDRYDLYTAMILGPVGTPYEDALFVFDIKLPDNYPQVPPLCHYHNFCDGDLNPHLFETGTESLLDYWADKGLEIWTSNSNLLQLLVSIQGLILVAEPYFTEISYEKEIGTKKGQNGSRSYNETAIINTVQSLIRMCKKPPKVFKEEICQYLVVHGPRMISRLRGWIKLNEEMKKQQQQQQTEGATSIVREETELQSQDSSQRILPLPGGSHRIVESELSQACTTKNDDITHKTESGLNGDFKESRVEGHPEFPLFPLSRGFFLCLRKFLNQYEKVLRRMKSPASN